MRPSTRSLLLTQHNSFRGAATLLLLILLLASVAPAQTSQPPLPEAERTRWFREAKFGLFIHWGVYAVIGRHEWARHRFQIPQADYDTYARRFNPVNFNADAWTDLAKSAGVRYIVITSKHHDGFSIYRSQVSDYDMEITSYQGDPLKMLAEAAQRKGLRLGFYHSIMDWHHPDYVPKRAWEVANPNEGGNLDRYIEFMKAQLRELLTGYGEVAVMWFDGEWEHSTQEMHSDEVYDFIRKLQPNTLINDRLYKREPGNRADFGTPEQFVPATGMKDPSGKPILWESCVTINNDSWGYNKYETEFKTERDLIRMLIEVVSKGGNLLLNVGPRPDGRIQSEFVTRLQAIGRWLKVNGEAIYGTTASPFARLPFFGRATAKGNTVYLHVFQWPADGRLRAPGLANKVVSARLLARPAAKLAVRREGAEVLVSLPRQAPDEIASVVELVLDGPPSATPYVIRPDSKGVLTLGVESCEIETRFEQRAKKENALGYVFLTRWTRADDIPTWTFSVPSAGRYQVEITYGSAGKGAGFTVAAGSSQVTGSVASTQGEWVFKTFQVGEIQLPAGEQTLQVKASVRGGPGAMNLEKVVLRPVTQ
jgi:alpha-L-fucosidase